MEPGRGIRAEKSSAHGVSETFMLNHSESKDGDGIKPKTTKGSQQNKNSH